MTNSQEVLIAQGYDFLAAEEYQDAREVGHALIRQGEEAGYRIAAQAYAGVDEWDKAIHILREGIDAMPDEWHLWLQLGNFLSDKEDFQGAMDAYEKAIACPGVQTDWIRINQAVLMFRQGEVEESLNTLQQVTDPEVLSDAFALQLNLLDQLGQHALIIELAKEELEHIPSPEDEEAASTLSRICATIATACWYEEKEQAEILHYLRQSIVYDRSNPDAAWLFREMDPQFSDSPIYFELVVQGTLVAEEVSEELESQTFLTTYGVVADSEEEALNYIKTFEIDAIDKKSLRIVSQETEAADTEDAKGIYVVGGFGFFEQENNHQA